MLITLLLRAKQTKQTIKPDYATRTHYAHASFSFSELANLIGQILSISTFGTNGLIGQIFECQPHSLEYLQIVVVVVWRGISSKTDGRTKAEGLSFNHPGHQTAWVRC